jgi:hypothetical protein
MPYVDAGVDQRLAVFDLCRENVYGSSVGFQKAIDAANP